MKKKILPLALVFVFCFSGVLALQIFMGRLQNGAGLSDEKRESYEALFQNERFVTKEGALVRLKDVKAPVVVVFFWAKYCLPCLAEMKELKAFQEKYSHEQVFFLGVNEDPAEQAKAIEFAKREYKLELPLIEDGDNLIARRFEVENLPTSFIFVHGMFYKRIDGPISFESEPWAEWVK